MIALLFGVASAAEFTAPGEARYTFALPPDVVVDADGTHTDQAWVLEQRFRLGLVAKFSDKFSATTEWDVGSGQLLGDTWALSGPQDERLRGEYRARTVDGIGARKLELDGRAGPLDLQAGLTTSHWGLGMLANDGAHDPLFGKADFGDRVFRVRAATMPWLNSHDLPLVIVVAADLVAADETSRLLRDEVALQGVAAVQMHPKEGSVYGVYFVGRHQTADGRATNVGVADAAFDVPVALGDWRLRLAGEAAGVLGRTSLATTYNSADHVDVRSLGAALQTELGAPDDVVVGHLRAGFASGDGNPDDGGSHDFTFDRDYDVGMLLFDERQAALEAGLSSLVSDPTVAGRPPDGVETLTTEGAFRHATFVQPAVVVAPLDVLELRAGAVFAWSTAPQSNAFYTVRAGGTPMNALNEPISGYGAGGGYGLGTEIDWAVRLHGGEATKDWTVHPELLVQGAHAFLAEAAAGSGDKRLDLVTAIARARW